MPPVYVFYRTPQIGSGTRQDPFRSALANYVVNDGSGADFWDLLNDSRPVRYALARADSAVHATITGDATITALSGQLADLTAVDAWLDDVLPNVPPAIQALFESDGISVAWTAAQTTKRQFLGYLTRIHVITQDMARVGSVLGLQFAAQALTATVGQVPANVRQAVSSWMTSKGLATGWITGATTVRQVLQYIIANIDWPVLPLGPATFA